MCGIAGFVACSAPSDSDKTLRRMTGVLRHRGPDDDGFYQDGVAFLGQRRLSIIDVAGGRQPMANETGSCWITYNGEIFNHASVRPELEKAGHRYATRCDTETVLHAYEEYGPQSVTRFRGMFAFAIWDRDRRRLFCARDRLGIKPFYYCFDGTVFAFASEIKALLARPECTARLEEETLPECLAFGYVSEERTLFRGVKKLMPGHWLMVDASSGALTLRIERYWDAPAPAGTDPRPDEEWIGETRRRLEESVEMRLMSDVPLGMFLSGGVDSSAIAALMKRLRSEPVKTFAVGYADERYSELSYARQVAGAIGTDHHEVRIGLEDFFAAVPKMIWHEDEPLAWPSSVSLHFVSALAARQVKVALTGEGSDELFGGYERYRWNLLNDRWARRYGLVPGPLRRRVRDWIAATPLLRAELRRKLGHTFLGRDGSIESLFLDNFYCAFSREAIEELLASPGAAVYANYRRHWDARPEATLLRRMLYADQKTYLVELLMKQDQMSMSASLESRVPFLDHTFVEFAAGIPDRLKIRNGEQKYVLKKAVEDLLPPGIVYRKKMGFPTPLRRWLLEERAAGLYPLLTAPGGFLAEHLDLKRVAALLDRHRSGVEDATDRIWRLLNLQVWGDVFLAGNTRWLEEGLLGDSISAGLRSGI